MRAAWTMIGAAVFAAGCASVSLSGTAGGRMRVYGEDDRRVETVVGGSFKVSLASNPSTGYAWEVRTTGAEGLVRLAASDYVAPPAPMPGRPGREEFLFRAVGRGTGRIVLVYKRAWEAVSEGERRLTYEITVR